MVNDSLLIAFITNRNLIKLYCYKWFVKVSISMPQIYNKEIYITIKQLYTVYRIIVLRS